MPISECTPFAELVRTVTRYVALSVEMHRHCTLVFAFFLYVLHLIQEVRDCKSIKTSVSFLFLNENTFFDIYAWKGFTVTFAADALCDDWSMFLLYLGESYISLLILQCCKSLE